MMFEKFASVLVMALAAVGCGAPMPEGCERAECGRSPSTGLSCGSCGPGYVCSASRTCDPGPSPVCGSRRCGPDGVGGSCGTCGATMACTDEGNCIPIDCSPRCTQGFVCNAGTCALNPDTRWDIIAYSAVVPERTSAGEAWDAFGGLPDPYLCYTVGTSQTCTAFSADTTHPVWNTVVGTFSASSLLSQQQRFSIADDDVSADDSIAATASTFVLPAQYFTDGGWTSTGYVTTTFRLVPSTR